MIRVSLGQGQMAAPLSSSTKADAVATSGEIQETNSNASHSVPLKVIRKEVKSNENYDQNDNDNQNNINDYDDDDDDDDEEEDDWDTFQSLPATNNAISAEKSGEENTETEVTSDMAQEAQSSNLETQDDNMESKDEDPLVGEQGVALSAKGEVGGSKDMSSSRLEGDENLDPNVDEPGVELHSEDVVASQDVSSSFLQGDENQDPNVDEQHVELHTEDAAGASKDASISMLEGDENVDKKGIELCTEDEVALSKVLSRSMLEGEGLNEGSSEPKEVQDSTKESGEVPQAGIEP